MYFLLCEFFGVEKLVFGYCETLRVQGGLNLEKESSSSFVIVYLQIVRALCDMHLVE